MHNVPSLIVMIQAYNQLEGSIPGDWLSTGALNILSIEANRISGQIPDPWHPGSPTPIGEIMIEMEHEHAALLIYS